MPVDAQIPLSGIAPKLPTAGDVLSLADVMQQMRERRLKSEQHTAQLASQKAMEGLMTGMSAYYSAPDDMPEEDRRKVMKSAQKEFFDNICKSGKAGTYGWTAAKCDEFANHDIDPKRAEMILDSVPQYKDLVKRFSDIRAGRGEGKGVSLQSIGQAPSQPAPVAPAQPEPEMTPEEADKKYEQAAAERKAAGIVDPPLREEGGMKIATGRPVGLESQQPGPPEPEESVERFYARAKAREADATRLRKQGRYDLADKASADAKDLRASASALQTRQQKDTALEQKDEDLEIKRAREKRIQASIDGAVLRPEDASFIAKEVWAGNQTAASGLARNQQAKTAVIRAITDEGRRRNATPEDLAAKVQEFAGGMQAQRSLGARAGSVELGIATVENLGPLVEKASAELKRTNIRALNDLYEYALSKTSSPELRALSAQINGFINVYARTIGGGTPHVDDKIHAREVLDRGFSHGDIMAAVRALESEMYAEMEAVPTARGRLSEGTSGRKREEKPPTTYRKEKKAEPIKWEDLK